MSREAVIKLLIFLLILNSAIITNNSNNIINQTDIPLNGEKININPLRYIIAN